MLSPENKILEKISEFTVVWSAVEYKQQTYKADNISWFLFIVRKLADIINPECKWV